MSSHYESYACDAVVLTALGTELRAVLAHMRKPYEIVHPLGTVYYRGIFVDKRRIFTVVVAEIGAGGAGAAAETERALTFFHPQVIFFVGIAGGLKEVRPGDVVVGTKVYNYETGKAAPNFRPRLEIWRSSYALEQRAKAEAHKENWLVRLGDDCPSPAPRVFVGAIAAGEKIVYSKRSNTYRLLRTTYEDAFAVEMEGHGFLSAVRADRAPYALVIRGISDMISNKAKADLSGTQEIAARHAAAFAFEVLSRFDAPSQIRDYQIHLAEPSLKTLPQKQRISKKSKEYLFILQK